MNRRSIRWRLFLWYALILFVSFALLAWALRRELEDSLVRDADARMALRVATVEHKIEEYPEATLQAEVAAALPTEVGFDVWNASGELVASSGEDREAPVPRDERRRTIGTTRIVTADGPGATRIRLTMNIANELERIDRFLRVLFLATSAVLALALVGGWIVTTRALTSIEGVTATARRISGDNLTERIDVASVPTELTGLARTLNESFERLEAGLRSSNSLHRRRVP